MSWYAQENFADIPGDNPTLVIAFANMLQKMGEHDFDPIVLGTILTQDDPIIDWWSIAEYMGDVDLSEVTDKGGWPESSHAIVKYHIGDSDFYHAVADHKLHSIIDSEDGKIRPAATYGIPVAWASYKLVSDHPIKDAPDQLEPNFEQMYEVKEGENIWDVARQLNLSTELLIDFNDIKDPRKVKPGDLLSIPIIKPKEAKTVEYQVLEQPQEMHVITPGGTQKYSFGNAKKWSDITATGPRYAENSNIMILAIAHVHLEEEGLTAAYYMDSMALGDYIHTGRVAYTIGFNHSHLAEGHVEMTTPVRPPIIIPELTTAPTAVVDVAPVEEEVAEWKTTLKPLYPDRRQVTFIAADDFMVREMDDRRPDKPLFRNQGVKIIYTFERDGIFYGLPASHEKNGYWYGIPMDLLTHEDELYNYEVPLADRVIMHRPLSLQEHGLALFAKASAQLTRLKTWLEKHKKKE